MAATAALVAEAPVPLVYGLAALAATSITITRPAQGAILPILARTPDELTAANVASSWTESIGVLVGPAVAALLAVAGARRHPHRGRGPPAAPAQRPNEVLSRVFGVLEGVSMAAIGLGS
jgi:hypothetical protein